MQTRVAGTTMPILEVTLGSGERLIAEGGDVGWSSTTSTRCRAERLFGKPDEGLNR